MLAKAVPVRPAMTLVSGTVLILGVRGLAILTGVATTVLLARSLGAAGYGGYLFLLNLAMLVSIPLSAGLPVLLTRQIAIYRATRHYGSITGLLGSGAVFLASAGAVVTGLLVFGNRTFEMLGPEQLSLVLLLMLLLPVTQAVVAVIYGYERAVLANVVESILRPISFLALLLILLMGQALTIENSLGAYALSLVLTLGVGGWQVRRLYRPAVSRAGRWMVRHDLRGWLRALLPLSAITLAGVLNGRVDVVLLGQYSAPAEVASYGVAQQIVGIAGIVRITTLGIAGPRFANLFALNRMAEIRALVVAVNRINVAGAILLTLCLCLFARPLITGLLDDGFAPAANLAVIASLNILFISLLGPSPTLLTMCGFERLFLRATAAMTLLNVALNLIFIPRFGAYGALLSSIGAELLFQATCLWFCRKHLNVNTLRLMKP